MIGINAALSFLTSRLGMAAIAAVLGCWFGYSAASNGAAVRALETDNAALQARMAEVQADLRRANAAADQAAREAAGLRDLQRDLAEKVDAYATELEARRMLDRDLAQVAADDRCSLTADDVERLRGIK